MTQKEQLNKLYKKYGLEPEDTFKSPQGWTIIRRNGIDKVQAKSGVIVSYEHVVIERDFVVIKAIGTLGDKVIETYGEADKKTNCRQSYPVAMAEKRAMSRAVLKLSGLYALGHYGEDEGDFTELKHIPANIYSQMQSKIIKGEKDYDEVIEYIEKNYVIGESQKYALKQIKAQV